MEGTGKQEMDALVDEILKSYEAHPETCSINTRNRISKDIIIDILEEIRSVVFPGYFEVKNLNAQSIEYHIGELLEDIHYRLRKQVAKALYHTNEKSIREEDAQLRAEEIVKAFRNEFRHCAKYWRQMCRQLTTVTRRLLIPMRSSSPIRVYSRLRSTGIAHELHGARCAAHSAYDDRVCTQPDRD